MMVLFFDNI